MPRPVLYHTPEEKRQARRLRNQQCYERRREEYNALRRERYHKKKRSQMKAIAEKEHKHFDVPKTIKPPEPKKSEAPKAMKSKVDREIEREIERELSLARKYETRPMYLVRHSPLDFLTGVCTHFEENRVVNVEAAQSCIYSHIEKFEKIQQDLAIAEVGLLQFTGVWKELVEVRRIIGRISAVVEYLIDIYEVALVDPGAVYQFWKQERFKFQQRLM
ncbi:hypothetical protein EST38_g13404 [Candolleomyces aberdarensis]|uniref:Uncharacterized protein n=1 Tax=Candolleomyces aberdarensis TaxID=2316362 RepID=A0A4Q2CZW2_9AGAR|nr:hypothetical protein EST38_g13404 [Candolleomyces aberdarensis]